MSPAVQDIHNQMAWLKKTVQTIKNIFKRAKAEGGNALLSILEYRTTPVDGLASPAQLLMGRQLRSVLPTTSKHLEPKTINPDEVTAKRQHLQASQKNYYDRTSHQMSSVRTGDNVYVKLTKDENWKPAQVVAQSSTPRSFSVQTEGGQIYRRNRRHIRHTAQPGQYTQTPSESSGPSGHLNAAQLPPGQLAPDATNYLPGCHAHPTAAQLPPGQPATGAANFKYPICATRSGRQVKPPQRLDL